MLDNDLLVKMRNKYRLKYLIFIEFGIFLKSKYHFNIKHL
jgi:hypothetical protein